MLKKLNAVLTLVLVVCVIFFLFMIYKTGKEEKGKIVLTPMRGYKTTFESYYAPNIPAGYVTFQSRIIFKDDKKPQIAAGKKDKGQDIYIYPDLKIELRFSKESMYVTASGRVNPNQMWISTVGRFKKIPDTAEIIFINPGYKKVICRVPIYDNYTILPDTVFFKE